MSNFAGVKVTIKKNLDGKALDAMRNRFKKKQNVVRVGIPSSAKETDGTSMVLIATVQEFGSPSKGIPERPAFRQGINNALPTVKQLNRTNLVAIANGKMTTQEALGQLGAVVTGSVQKEIKDGSFEALKEATIKRKGSDKPLIDTGQYRQSFAWELSDD